MRVRLVTPHLLPPLDASFTRKCDDRRGSSGERDSWKGGGDGGWRCGENATFRRSQRQFPRFFESFQKFKILDPDPDPDPGSGIRVLKPDPDPDPEKFKNRIRIRIPDPEKFKNWIRIRIRIQAKSPDPTGSGSGSETLSKAIKFQWIAIEFQSLHNQTII